MKKIFRNTFIFILVFICIGMVRVYAEKESCDTAYKNKDAIAACKMLEEYCMKGSGSYTKGCKYDSNNTLYTKSGTIKNKNAVVSFTSGNLDLTQGYEGLDKDGNVVFAGCYRGNFSGTSYIDAGTYFVFKVIKLSGGKCSVAMSDIVMQKGTKFGSTSLKPYTWDGSEGIGGDGATYKWVATANGKCPVAFGLTQNVRGFTSDKHRYLFANDANDMNLGVKSSWLAFWTWGSRQEYEATVGCTVQDKLGLEQAIACYDDAITNIQNKTCPSDISNISSFKGEIQGLAKKCETEMEKLYKVDFLRSNKETFTKNLNDAINKKLTSCQYTDCKLTAIETENLANALSSKTCKDGCAEKEGTEYDNCINCLKGAYSSIGLSSTKTQCLLDSQKAKDAAQTELAQTVEDDQESHVQEELQAQQDFRQAVYSAYSSPALDIEVPEMPGENGGGLSECDEILGSDLTAIVKASITILQIVGAIIAVVKGMMTLIPPVLAKDADALKKSSKTLVTMAIILVVIFLFRPLLTFLGSILDFDTSCIL